ncbi:hypothetical protein ACSSNL_13405 [Thalassobius sp. S69A]|uniref:hypothetical protein n=1 Tax=unclassified Thalassovita TaxID=2619711 RepID=UPI003C7B087D
MAVSVADWIAYAAARGDTIADDVDSAAALVRATDYIRFSYVSRFMSGYDLDSDNVDAAIYEAAKIELGKPGFFSKTFTPGEAKVLTEVKGIKWQVIGDKTSADGETMTPVSTKVDAMLRLYINRAAAVLSV